MTIETTADSTSATTALRAMHTKHYKSLGGPTGLSFNFDACGVSWVTDAQAII